MITWAWICLVTSLALDAVGLGLERGSEVRQWFGAISMLMLGTAILLWSNA
jgi:hypothetical protein